MRRPRGRADSFATDEDTWDREPSAIVVDAIVIGRSKSNRDMHLSLDVVVEFTARWTNEACRSKRSDSLDMVKSQLLVGR
ncbi:hypothetical protein Poly41_44770 [Novipirellula artificiosorum]|uniref:Uncharacterized protein n=1 Tax=Novipirellula artificiosorum TaxID=2528016 RepID=A0A5C6DC45_9BACT|nr:hypothetical protein Poly41_44770 [Novipirellula artificiosorum]